MFTFEINPKRKDDKEFWELFFKYHDIIASHPKLINALKTQAKTGLKLMEQILPRNLGYRNYERPPLHKAFKLGRLQTKKYYRKGQYWKNPIIRIVYKNFQIEYAYSLAGRRLGKNGEYINYKFQYSKAVSNAPKHIWKETKQDWAYKIKDTVIEILNDFVKQIRRS